MSTLTLTHTSITQSVDKRGQVALIRIDVTSPLITMIARCPTVSVIEADSIISLIKGDPTIILTLA